MTEDIEVIDRAKYKSEIESFKRVASKLNELRKWLLNTSLAGLAFAFTVFFQVKSENGIPFQGLAASTVALFMLSTALAFFCRMRSELDSFISDTQGIYNLLPIIRDLVESEEKMATASKEKLASIFDKLISYTDSDRKAEIGGSPFYELWLMLAVSISLFSALVSLCAYIWRYLFAL